MLIGWKPILSPIINDIPTVLEEATTTQWPLSSTCFEQTFTLHYDYCYINFIDKHPAGIGISHGSPFSQCFPCMLYPLGHSHCFETSLQTTFFPVQDSSSSQASPKFHSECKGKYHSIVDSITYWMTKKFEVSSVKINGLCMIACNQSNINEIILWQKHLSPFFDYPPKIPL